jgi:hypothetical protein
MKPNRAPTWLVFGVALSCACSSPSQPRAPAPPALVESPITERELSIVRLSRAAARRLGVTRAQVEPSHEPAVRLSGGEVIVPPGSTLLVTAPVSGELRRVNVAARGSAGERKKEERPVAPGALVKRGDVLLTLVPFAPVDRDVRARAEREVAASAAQLAAAEARVTRLSQLGAERSVSRRAYEDAVAGRDILRADVHAAEARAQGLRATPLLADVALPIKAPCDGVLRALSVAPGQAVSAGAALFEVVEVAALQVRVPVYAGDLGRLAPLATAHVRALSATVDQTFVAPAVQGPPTAAPERATVDRYFALAEDAPFVPGERVLVELPLLLEQAGRSVPRTSVIYDAAGAGWVYACAGDDAYQRARIDPIRLLGERLVFERGPELGACVASVGAAELFGSEFEPGH